MIHYLYIFKPPVLYIYNYPLIDYEAGLQHGISQGHTEGIQQKAIKTAKCAFAMNLSMEQIISEQIISLTGLPREIVDELANNI